jgi:predicted HNH restriction endonuclease
MSDFFYDVIVPIIVSVISSIVVAIALKIKWRNLFLKRKMINVLSKYIEKKDHNLTKKLGLLFDKGRNKLERKYDFKYHSVYSIQYRNFMLDFTRPSEDSPVERFIINDTKRMKLFYSIEYLEDEGVENDIQVLRDFIKELKTKK